MKIGFTELILVAIVAFVVIGPDKLPEYARKLGKMLRELKKYTGAASDLMGCCRCCTGSGSGS